MSALSTPINNTTMSGVKRLKKEATENTTIVLPFPTNSITIPLPPIQIYRWQQSLEKDKLKAERVALDEKGRTD